MVMRKSLPWKNLRVSPLRSRICRDATQIKSKQLLCNQEFKQNCFLFFVRAQRHRYSIPSCL